MYEPLQRLTRHRFYTVISLVREKSFFLKILFTKVHDGDEEELPDILRKTVPRSLIGYHSIETLARLPLDELACLVQQDVPNPDQRPAALSQQIANLVGPKSRTDDSVDSILQMSLRGIRTFEDAIARSNLAITTEMNAIDSPVLSIPGLGPVLAAGIVAEIQAIERFPADASLAKYAGLSWEDKRAGDFFGDEPANSPGNAYLRYYLIQAADQVRRHVPEYEQYYLKKHQEARELAPNRALMLTARKLVRLVYALISTNQRFRPD